MRGHVRPSLVVEQDAADPVPSMAFVHRMCRRALTGFGSHRA